MSSSSRWKSFRGDASRYLVDQQVEVDLEPQRWPRSRADVRKVGTKL
jgi:hypothetical protein